MSLKANYGYVIIKQDRSDSLSKGGIALPETSIKPLGKGTVVDFYDDGFEEFIDRGDVVYFPYHSGHEIECDGEKLLILKNDQVLAVEKND